MGSTFWSALFALLAGTASMHGCGGGDSADGAEPDPANTVLPGPLPEIPAESEDEPTPGPTDGPTARPTSGPADEEKPTAAGALGAKSGKPSQPESGTAKDEPEPDETPHDVYEFTPQDFHNSYYKIFQSGNRNAASHKWFQYLKNKKEEPGLKFDFEHLSKFYCPISGSPTYGTRLAKISLPRVGSGELAEGAFSYCCTPCFCDLKDFAQVDSVTVAGETYDAIVIGDPCKDPARLNAENRLNVSFQDPFNRGEANLATVAPELECECTDSGCQLSEATFSNNGFPVIGLFFNASEGVLWDLEDDCQLREEQGFRSGMGLIFRAAAEITPIESS